VFDVLQYVPVLVAMLLACSGCVREPMPGVGDKQLSIAERGKCTSQGGNVGQILPGFEGCIRQTTDGGKSCSDGSQCEGTCNAPSSAKFGVSAIGTCSAVVNRMRCVNLVIQGKASGEVCFDSSSAQGSE
jgi:hypothetical protein